MSSKIIRTYDGIELARKYKKYRPGYPYSVKDAILKYMQNRVCPGSSRGKFGTMIDVGCGSGQATHMFSPYFESILGLDISAAQIKMAKENNTSHNVSFHLTNGTLFPVEDESVDFVNCATAAHWLDMESFQKECERILKPGGCVAIYCYTFELVKSNLDGSMLFEFRDVLLPFLKACNVHPRTLWALAEKYQRIFNQLTSTSKEWIRIPRYDLHYTVASLKSELMTIGEYHTLMASHPPRDPLQELSKSLKTKLNAEGCADHEVEFIMEMEMPMIVFSKN